jgi:cytochrome c oxidase cbb3-type subunit III
MRWAVPALLAGLLLACGRVEESPRASTAAASAAVAAAAHERGRKIYNFRCYYCHGYSGDAKTLAATFLTPQPRDFRHTAPESLPRERMLASIANGRTGTAMKGFANVLSAQEIEAVADFVRAEFMIAKAVNTRYHTAENGWPDHGRYEAAFPFARGEIALDTPPSELSPVQLIGRQLFMTSCVSCHDRARVATEGAAWDARPLSYPRNGYDPAEPAEASAPSSKGVDAVSGASPYRLHDRAPSLPRLSVQERQGERLYQQNCAFCHALDGTGRNWIGSFLDPHPRDLTSADAMRGMTKTRLADTIAEGLPGTSMPAWKYVLRPEEMRAIAAYVARAFHPIPD